MHVGQYRVRYRDVYSAGVVLNARYLDVCDEAFTEFFRALGFDSRSCDIHTPSPTTYTAKQAGDAAKNNCLTNVFV